MNDDTQPPFNEPSDFSDNRYAPPVGQKSPSGRRKKLLILISIILVAGVVFTAWKLFKPKSSEKSPNPASQSQPNPPPQASEIPSTAGKKTHKSSAVGIEFAYPSDWTVSEKDGGIHVASPQFDYETASGENTTGTFRIYIRKGAREVDSKYIGRGVVIKPSEKLVYTEPAAGQRKDTNLSSFGYDSSDNFAYFLVAGNYELKKDDQLGPNYGKEADAYIIVGGFGSPDLVDDLQFTEMSIDNYTSPPAYQQGIEILKSIKL